MTTNAQAALQAAATVFSTGRGHTSPTDVQGMAYSFKLWLDRQDPKSEPEVSHHISCISRLPGQVQCSCRPVPYVNHPTSAVVGTTNVWTALVRPRNTQGDWELTRVAAHSADQATSLILSKHPGHAWTELTDTGQPAVPKPGPRA